MLSGGGSGMVSRNSATRKSCSARANHSPTNSSTGSGIEHLPFVSDRVSEAAGHRLVARELLRGVDEDVHRQTHAPEEPSHLGVTLRPRLCGLLNHQDVNVAVRSALAASPGAEEDDLLRMNRLGDPAHDRLDDFFILHSNSVAQSTKDTK